MKGRSAAPYSEIPRPMTDKLKTIVDANLCHGCGGCAAIAPEGSVRLRMAETGYRRPEVTGPLPADYADKVDAICTGQRIEQDAAGRTYHPSWGPLVTVEVGHALDPEVRFRGSSGGMLSGVAVYLLETGAVDFVVHTRADPEDAVGNVTGVSHSREDVIASAGSRYAPSSPLAELESHLATGKTFAFIGKPCDIATLRAMARQDPRIDAQIPYKLSFFCAGVPSRHGAQALLRKMGVEPEAVRQFDYRGNGWPGLARARSEDGSEATMDYAESWGAVLSRHLQFRCKICPDGVGEFADIAAADAWYGKDGYPDFDERDGRSLVVARTVAGRKLLDAMLAADRIALDPLDIDEIAKMQPYQVDRKRAVVARCFAMLLLGRKLPRYTGLELLRNIRESSPVYLARNMLGTLRRLPRTPRGS